VDLSAPERVYIEPPRRLTIDWAVLLFAALPAPALGASLTAVFAYNFQEALAWIAFLSVAPGTALAFALRRRAKPWASAGYALLALTVTACWIAVLVFYMVWEIGNDWVPMRN
jgi:hypothetical protein